MSAPLPDRPTGAELVAAIRDAAQERGVTLQSLVVQLSPKSPTTYLEQLAIAIRPTPATVTRVRALLAGEAVTPAWTHGVRTNSTANTSAAAQRHAAAKAEDEARRRRSFQAHEVRRPGEKLADTVRRIGAEIDADEAAEAEARRCTDLQALSSPSSLLRRAQRDWPDQCGAVRALAADLGVGLAEAWHRVIKAGLDCLAEAEGETAHG